MVNVRKISAIAAGALFVGATLGMAAAVTVPSDFSKDMLAKNGEEQAQLVVGANAPGKDADTESANVIKDAVADKLAVTGAGGDVEIEYPVDDLDDDDTTAGNDDGFTGVYTGNANAPSANVNADEFKMNSTVDTAFIKINCSLKYDANGDGDVKDSDDYVLYNGVYVVDATSYTIRMAYWVPEDSTYSDGDGTVEKGEIVKIKGKSYVITDPPSDNQNFEVAPAIKKKLQSTALDPDNAIVFEGTLKGLVYNDSGTYYLKLYDGNSLLESIQLNANQGSFADISDDLTSDQYKAYKMFYKNTTTAGEFLITMGKKGEAVKVSDGQEDVFGYAAVKVDNGDYPGNDEIMFLSDPMDLSTGETYDIEGTYFQIDFDTAKQVDIQRKKTTTVASGSKIKSTTDPGNKFLDSTKVSKIWVTATGGETKTPELEIVDEESADKDNYNLVLIGGPVANTLTADLVTAGKSTVDWYTSEGDIEVIADAFTDGKYAIIVAGKDRDATRAAADALAAAL